MNRDKYVKNSDYREGYNEAVEDNDIKIKSLLRMEIDPIIKQLQNLSERLQMEGKE